MVVSYSGCYLLSQVDVNPSFDSVRGFEFTDEIAIFDLFGVGLVHGWVVDPQSENEDIRSFTYNQLVGRLVAILGSETPVHLLTTHSSITSRQGSTKKENGPDSFTSEPPLITLDSTDLGPSLQTIDTNVGEVNTGDQAVQSSSQDGSNIVKNTVDDILNRIESSFQEEDNPPTEPISDQVGAGSGKEPALVHKDKENLQNVSANTSDSKQNGKDFSRRAQVWLQNTSSQLTPFGLHRLLQDVKDEQLVVFFRNNHFNTVYKKADSLYILVTDQGYLSEPNVVWEKLDAVDGDTQMMTDNFAVFGRHEYPEPSGVDLDLQKALSASMDNSQLQNNDGRHTFNGNACTLPDDFLVGDTLQNPSVSKLLIFCLLFQVGVQLT